jgi:hypothetical protein
MEHPFSAIPPSRVTETSQAARFTVPPPGTAAFQATYFTAVTMTGIAITALVVICSAPVMIAALAVLVLRERLTTRVLVSIALGVLGGTARTTGLSRDFWRRKEPLGREAEPPQARPNRPRRPRRPEDSQAPIAAA